MCLLEKRKDSVKKSNKYNLAKDKVDVSVLECYKKQRFEVEIKKIDEEINRSNRFNFSFGVLVVEVSHSAPKGLSKLFPGKTISFHLMRKYIRGYDKLMGPYFRRYYIILPQGDRTSVNAVKERIYELAQEHK